MGFHAPKSDVNLFLKAVIEKTSLEFSRILFSFLSLESEQEVDSAPCSFLFLSSRKIWAEKGSGLTLMKVQVGTRLP